MRAIKILLFPFYFLIVLPIEYPLWKAYKKEKQIKESLIKFIYQRL